MEESRRQILLEAGVNVETAMNRFQDNEDLLVLFLQKFADDPNFQMLKDKMQQKDYKEAFNAAHAFKGLSGNLSLDTLFELVCKEVEFLRHGENEEAEKHLPLVVREYERAVALLKKL